MGWEIKRLKRSWIPLVKVRWNSRRGPEFTWEREDSFKQKYPQLFTNRASSSTTSHVLLASSAAPVHYPSTLIPSQAESSREPMRIYLMEPLPPVDSPTAESPGYVAELDPEEDPEEYEDDETEDGPIDYPMDGGEDGDDDDDNSSGDDVDDNDEDEEEEEHLAPADSAVVVPTVELASPPKGIEPVIPPPSTDITTTGARITDWEHLARCTAPSAHSSPPHVPSLLLPSSGCPTQIQTLRIASTQALVDAVTTTLPSPPLPSLPPSLYIPPHVDHRDIIPESEQPPRKRSCLFVLGSRYKVRESSTARPTGGRGVDYGFVSTLDAEERRRGIRELGSSETKQIVEEEAYFPEGLAHAIGLSQAAHYELQTYREQVYAHESQLHAHQTQLQLQGTLIQTQHQIEKMESVFNTSGCAIENQVKFATCTLLGAALTWWNGQIRTLGPDAYSMTWEVLKKKMTDKYCPQGEIKKLEIEL
ncbi:hypothetical protein Tco_0348132 [Tanacetum coccineum]